MNKYVNGVSVPLTAEEIEQIRVVRERNQKKKAQFQYKEQRANAYPAIEDQLDEIYHNGVAAWKVTIKAVKDTYPKPGEE